jgi:hypothetical protein
MGSVRLIFLPETFRPCSKFKQLKRATKRLAEEIQLFRPAKFSLKPSRFALSACGSA